MKPLSAAVLLLFAASTDTDGFAASSPFPSTSPGLHFQGPADGQTSVQQGVKIDWRTIPIWDDAGSRELYKDIKPPASGVRSSPQINVMPGYSSYSYYKRTMTQKCAPWTGKTTQNSCIPDWFDTQISDGNPLRVRILIPPGVRSASFWSSSIAGGTIIGGVSLSPDQGLPSKAQRSLVHVTVNTDGTDLGGRLGLWGWAFEGVLRFGLRPLGVYPGTDRTIGTDSTKPYYVYLTLWSPNGRYSWGIHASAIAMDIGDAALYRRWVQDCLDRGTDCVSGASGAGASGTAGTSGAGTLASAADGAAGSARSGETLPGQAGADPALVDGPGSQEGRATSPPAATTTDGATTPPAGSPFPRTSKGFHFQGPADGQTSVQQGVNIHWRTLPIEGDPLSVGLYQKKQRTAAAEVSSSISVMPGVTSYTYYQRTLSYKCSPWQGRTTVDTCIPDWFDKGTLDGNPLRVRVLIPPGVRIARFDTGAINYVERINIFGGVSLSHDQRLPTIAERRDIPGFREAQNTSNYWVTMESQYSMRLPLRPLGVEPKYGQTFGQFPVNPMPYYVYMTLWDPQKVPWAMVQTSIDMYIGDEALYDRWVQDCLSAGTDCVPGASAQAAATQPPGAAAVQTGTPPAAGAPTAGPPASGMDGTAGPVRTSGAAGLTGTVTTAALSGVPDGTTSTLSHTDIPPIPPSRTTASGTTGTGTTGSAGATATTSGRTGGTQTGGQPGATPAAWPQTGARAAQTASNNPFASLAGAPDPGEGAPADGEEEVEGTGDCDVVQENCDAIYRDYDRKLEMVELKMSLCTKWESSDKSMVQVLDQACVNTWMTELNRLRGERDDLSRDCQARRQACVQGG